MGAPDSSGQLQAYKWIAHTFSQSPLESSFSSIYTLHSVHTRTSVFDHLHKFLNHLTPYIRHAQAEVFEEIATMEFPFEGIPTVPPRKNMTHMAFFCSGCRYRVTAAPSDTVQKVSDEAYQEPWCRPTIALKDNSDEGYVMYCRSLHSWPSG